MKIEYTKVIKEGWDISVSGLIKVEPMIKKAYISGPISGIENGNKKNFCDAEIELIKLGYIAINPHNIGYKIEYDFILIENKTPELIKKNWQDHMRADIIELCSCDCVFLLEGWETSKGANTELFVAEKLGLEIFYMKDKKPFDRTYNYYISKII